MTNKYPSTIIGKEYLENKDFNMQVRQQLRDDKYPVPHGLEKKVWERRMDESQGPTIRPTVKVIMFWLGESITDEYKIVGSKLRLGEELTQSEQNVKEGQNIHVPKMVDIDYSDVKNISPKNMVEN